MHLSHLSLCLFENHFFVCVWELVGWAENLVSA